MSDVLIRDVPESDLERLRAEAAARGVSLQRLLAETLHMQAAHLRRREALARTDARLHGRRPVSDAEREAVLDTIDREHADRSSELADRGGE